MADERLFIEPCIQQPWGNDIIRVRQTIACRVIRKFIALLSIFIVASVGSTFAIIWPRFLGSNLITRGLIVALTVCQSSHHCDLTSTPKRVHYTKVEGKEK